MVFSFLLSYVHTESTRKMAGNLWEHLNGGRDVGVWWRPSYLSHVVRIIG